jgi:DNA-directed RNA polymerase beta subunit
LDGEDAPIKLIEVSASFKILLDELKSVGIYPKVVVGRKV